MNTGTLHGGFKWQTFVGPTTPFILEQYTGRVQYLQIKQIHAVRQSTQPVYLDVCVKYQQQMPGQLCQASTVSSKLAGILLQDRCNSLSDNPLRQLAWAIIRLPKPRIVRHHACDQIVQALCLFFVQYATKSWGGARERGYTHAYTHTQTQTHTHTHTHLEDTEGTGLANIAVSVKLSEAPLEHVQVPHDLEEGEQRISHDDCSSFVVLLQLLHILYRENVRKVSLKLVAVYWRNHDSFSLNTFHL